MRPPPPTTDRARRRPAPGQGSGLTDSYDTSGSDTTPPVLSNIFMQESNSGNMIVAFQSDENIGRTTDDLQVTVSGPNGATYSFDRNDFTKVNSNPNQYQLMTAQSFDDGTGDYTATIQTATDEAGNDGGGSSQTATYTYGGGGGTPSVVSKDIEYISGSAKFKNDAEVEKNIDFQTEALQGELSINLFVKQSKLSPGEQKRELGHSAVGFDETTFIKLEITVKNLDPGILMGPADVDSWKVVDKSGSKKKLVVKLHPTTVQRNFAGSFNPADWAPSSPNYRASWEQAQAGVDAYVGLEAQGLPPQGGISKLDGARLNTDGQAFTVPQVNSGQLVFNVAAPHCKVGAKNDPNDPSAPEQCNSQYVNDDGFYEAVVPKSFWQDTWGQNLDASSLALQYSSGGSTQTLTNVQITKRNNGDLFIKATNIHYSKGTIKTIKDTTAPTADAGSDKTVDVSTSVSFDGSASSDGETSITKYEWDFDGDGKYEKTGEKPSYTFQSTGTHTVELRVTDGGSNTDTDTLTVTVEDGAPPTADAGSDQTIDAGTAATFDAAGSTDDSQITSYEWDVGADGTVDATGASASYTFDKRGTYTVELTVTDGAGKTDTDTLTVTVKDGTPPTADAGANRTVDVGGSVSLDASGSTDNQGIASYEWDVGADGSVDATGETASYTFSSAGTFTVELTVTDDAGNTDTDTLTVTVTNDTAPTADAGSNKSATTGTAVTLDASGSTDDGTITSYKWDVGADGSVDATGETATYTFDSAGTYTVELTVTDDAGNTDTDTLTVVVTPAVEAAVSVSDQTYQNRTTRLTVDSYRFGDNGSSLTVWTTSGGAPDTIIGEVVTSPSSGSSATINLTTAITSNTTVVVAVHNTTTPSASDIAASATATVTITPERTGSVTLEDQTVTNGTTNLTVASARASVDYTVTLHRGSPTGPTLATSSEFAGETTESGLTLSLNQPLTANATAYAVVAAADSGMAVANDSAAITVESEPSDDDPVDEYDDDGNDNIEIDELGQAAADFAQGDLSIAELAQLATNFAQSN